MSDASRKGIAYVAPFTWLTGHNHLLQQRDLSGRQACWLEKLGEFDFTVQYLLGVNNILPDTLSRMYSYNAPGTVRVPNKFMAHNKDRSTAKGRPLASIISMHVLVGAEALVVQPPRYSLQLVAQGKPSPVVARVKKATKPAKQAGLPKDCNDIIQTSQRWVGHQHVAVDSTS